MGSIINTKLFIFDLDGTIYHDGILIGDAKNTLQTLRNNGGKIVYLTNNSSRSKKAYVERLKNIGIFESQDVVYSSLDCALDYYKKYKNGKTVYAVATQEVTDYLISNGMKVVDESVDADIILLTFDTELTYKKIKRANELMVMGKEYISTHPDEVCPSTGISLPDAGSFIKMFKSSSGRLPDVILGKPYTYMADFLVDGFGISKDQITMFGDRLSTDIMFGVNSGINTALVLSGEATLEQAKASGIKIDEIIKDVNELPKILYGNKGE